MVREQWTESRVCLQSGELEGTCSRPMGVACASGLMFQCGKKSTASVVQEAFTVCLKLFLRTLLPTARSVNKEVRGSEQEQNKYQKYNYRLLNC